MACALAVAVAVSHGALQGAVPSALAHKEPGPGEAPACLTLFHAGLEAAGQGLATQASSRRAKKPPARLMIKTQCATAGEAGPATGSRDGGWPGRALPRGAAAARRGGWGVALGHGVAPGAGVLE